MIRIINLTIILRQTCIYKIWTNTNHQEQLANQLLMTLPKRPLQGPMLRSGAKTANDKLRVRKVSLRKGPICSRRWVQVAKEV